MRPCIRVSLRETPLAPVLLRGPAYKGRPWPFKPLAASMRLVPLRNTSTRPPDGDFARACEFGGCRHTLLFVGAGLPANQSEYKNIAAKTAPTDFAEPASS